MPNRMPFFFFLDFSDMVENSDEENCDPRGGDDDDASDSGEPESEQPQLGRVHRGQKALFAVGS